MNIQNKTVKSGFDTVTDGLLEYRRAISKKLDTLSSSEGDKKLRVLFGEWNGGLDELLKSISQIGDSIEGLETIFIEFGVYQADGKAD